MMRGKSLVLGLLVLVTACQKEDPVEEYAEDQQDVAMVERMSKPPFRPVIPKPITKVDMARYGLDHRGCLFTAQGDKAPVFVAGADEGFMHIGSDLQRFAARTTSAELPGEARSSYTGLSNWIDIVRQPDEGEGGTALHWPARLMLHDPQKRVAYMADGTMDCSRE
ncbi:hypothetical protein I5E68_09135 [Novosphingobium sp. YJ-S2-02]|uniref:Uncharacterized protein n=2 Tax=Novosphingobium aureum TaxID=2792964 RepID=A0A931MKN3_9SPHN|nr:hypothetical protein [Novosphingobium aureum]